MIKVPIQFSATPIQLRQIYAVLVGTTATVASRALAREMARQARAALATRQGALTADRAELQVSADKITEVDAELAEIANELGQLPDEGSA